MALITSSTIEINTKLKVDDEEIRELEKRLKELGLNIQIDIEEITKKRNAALSQSPLAIAGFSSHEIGLTGIGAAIGAIISVLLPIIIDSFKSELERSDALSKIDQSRLDLPTEPIQRAAELNKFLEDKKTFFEFVSPQQIAQSIIDNFNKTDVVLRIENVIAQDPEIAKFFDKEIIQEINEAVKLAVETQQAVNQASEKLSSEKLANNTLDFLGIGTELLQEQEKQIEIFQKLKSGGLDIGSEFSEGKESILDRTDAIKDEIQEKKESIKLNKEDNQSLLDLGKNQSMVTASTKQLTGNIEGQSESLRVGNQILNLTNEELLNLPGKLAIVDGAFIDATANQGEFAKSFEDVIKNTSEGAVIFGFTKEELLGLRAATDEATKSTENLGENGFTAVKENVEQAGNKLGTLDANLMNVADRNKEAANSQEQLNQAVQDGSVAFDNTGASAEEFGETIEQVQNQGGFFEGIKQGFKDFVENVQSNSELMADFFADTLSQMSQSFSDLFFNVITGRFDDLKDLAKQTFEAILRAFLDLVSAIATRQIVLSIAGVLGIDKKSLGFSDVANAAESAASAGKTFTDAAGNEFPATNGVPDPTELDPETALPVKDSGIGAGIGAGLLGIGIGSAIGGIINSDLTGLQQGISFGLGAAGAVTGFLIGGPIGAAIGGFIGSLVVPIITALFKKTPRLDIDFDSVKTEVGRRAAEVAEFLDPEFFKEQIGQISVKRGGVGLGRGGDEGIKDIIQEKIKETVDAVRAIIFKLPSDLAKQLNEALLNTKVDIDTVVKGERLLEFDAKGKKIKEKFEAFINGELQAKFLFAIRDFFQGAFESLGVLPGKAAAFIDTEFERFKNAKSPEERAQRGQELLADINAFVDAFNIVSGNVNDAIGQTIQEEELEYRLAA